MSLAILSSLLLFLASPGKFSCSPLAWIALIPLLQTISECQPKRAAKLGLLCGFFYYCAILYWILIVLGKYGSLPLWISLPALFLLALYMSLYLAIFAGVITWLGDTLPRLWIAPPLWVGLDLIRGHFLTGFPWMDLAYSQYQYPKIIQIADLTGHFGLTFLIVLVNCLLLEIYNGLKNNHLTISTIFSKNHLIASLIILLSFSYSIIRYQQIKTDLPTKETISIGLIQGNIDQSQKWRPEIQEKTVTTYLTLSKNLLSDNPVNLLIWPETALPFFPAKQPLFEKIIEQAGMWPDSSLITGAPHYFYNNKDGKTHYYNSAFLITPVSPSRGKNRHKPRQDPTIARYDKQHLVPFGEYIPFGEYLPSSMPIVHSMGNFSSGKLPKPIPCHNANIGLLICYESIFPDLARNRVKNGANLLINLTNDAWYGDSSAPWQQLAMVVFRAVENRRSFARSANTGISCFIDPLGRQVKLSPLFKPYSMAAKVSLLEENSPFTDYGHYFPWLCLLGLLPIMAHKALKH